VSATATLAPVLVSLLPVRDVRDRVVGYIVSTCPPQATSDAALTDDEARSTLDEVPRLARLAGRSILVPTTPALVRDGAIARFASTDAIWLLATSALDDARTRTAVERLLRQGFHFALDGFPEGEPLSSALVGSTIVLDAWRTPPSQLESRLRMLIEAGLRPLVRGVDDRATRQRALSGGATLHTGRLLVRGAVPKTNRSAELSVERALAMIGSFADGGPPNAAFDAYIQDDPNISEFLRRSLASAAVGVRGSQSISHAMMMFGRDAVMDSLVAIIARLLGTASGDPEIGFVALRRARLCERLGSALDPAPHLRARSAAGLLSVAEFAFGVPSASVAERIELPPLLRDTLELREGPLGRLVDAIDAFDNGWWDDLRARCTNLGISPLVLSQAYGEAWRDAREELGLTRAELS
jgi:c-di-GMP-related signal transduction protein